MNKRQREDYSKSLLLRQRDQSAKQQQSDLRRPDPTLTSKPSGREHARAQSAALVQSAASTKSGFFASGTAGSSFGGPER